MNRKVDRRTKPAATKSAGSLPGKTEPWKLSKLKWNSRQDSNFHPLNDADFDRLVDDMRRNGQRTPIEVTRDGRVIDGHQRLRAARKLGWTTVLVVVRYDLDGDESAIEMRMIEANENRRQLDVLDRVRLARRKLEIKEKRKPGGLSQCDEQDLRDQIGEMLSMSGRNVQRYLNILNAPMEVQRAFSENKLTMKLAERVARLGETARAQIASEIKAGGNPADVVAAHLPGAAPPEVNPDKGYELFIAHATHTLTALEGREDKVRGGFDLDGEGATLERMIVMCKKLIARNHALKKLRAKTLRGFFSTQEDTQP